MIVGRRITAFRRMMAVLAAGASILVALPAGLADPGGSGRGGLGLVQLGTDSVGAASASNYGYVFVRPSARVAAGRGKRLAYKSAIDLALSCRSSDSCLGGVTYREARRHGWVAKDTSGTEIASAHYAGVRLADVGSVTYQKRWLQNVRHFLRRHRTMNGVFIDNVIGSLSIWAKGQVPAKYPTSATWGSAMVRFIRRVGPALRRDGFYVALNALDYEPGDERSDTGARDAAWWRRLAPSADGLMAEYWQQNPNDLTQLYFDDAGHSWMGNWSGWERLIDVVQSTHRDFFGLQYAEKRDAARMAYGRASFLLFWHGRGGAYVVSSPGAGDPWSSSWTVDVGKPSGRRHRVGVGWQRRYSRGFVAVNPNPSVSQVFRLRGRYRAPGGEVVTSVVLGPISAAILVRARP
jgi:hypothetical protein